MIGGCTFSGRYSDPLAAPTATLIHRIPGWALLTAILLADQIIPVLHDHGKQERRDKLYCIFISVKIHQCKGSRESFCQTLDHVRITTNREHQD
jgi:hypothetical protein